MAIGPVDLHWLLEITHETNLAGELDPKLKIFAGDLDLTLNATKTA